ncbi:MAG: CBS domain-containing protein [Haloferacaceae archaeon]
MSPPEAVVRRRATVRAVAEALCETGTRSALVVDAAGSVVGLVSERALLSAVASGAGPDGPVGPHADGPVPTVDPDVTVRAAADLMAAERLGTLPVADEGAADPAGVVTAADVAPFVPIGRTVAADARRPEPGGDDDGDRGPRRPERSTGDRRGSPGAGVTTGR